MASAEHNGCLWLRTPLSAANSNVQAAVVPLAGKPAAMPSNLDPHATPLVGQPGVSGPGVPPPCCHARRRKRTAASLENTTPCREPRKVPTLGWNAPRCLANELAAAHYEESPCSASRRASTLIYFNKRVCRGHSLDGPATQSRETYWHAPTPAQPIARSSVTSAPKMSASEDHYVRYLRKLENRLSPCSNFLPGTGEPECRINADMRVVLVGWLGEVRSKPSEIGALDTETLFLAVNLLDRYLSVSPETPRGELQLLGCTCLWIASKYEQTAPMSAAYFEDDLELYSRQELKAMERRVLAALEYQVGAPTPYAMLLNLCEFMDLDPCVFYLASYLLELSLLEYEMLQHKPSTLAAAAIYLASLCVNKPVSDEDMLFLEANCSRGIVQAIQMMHVLHRNVSNADWHADSAWGPLRTTYEDEALGAVALIPPFDLPIDEYCQ